MTGFILASLCTEESPQKPQLCTVQFQFAQCMITQLRWERIFPSKECFCVICLLLNSKIDLTMILHPVVCITALIFLDLTKSQTSPSTFSLPSSSNPWPLSPIPPLRHTHGNDIRTHDFFMKHSFFNTARVWNTRFLSSYFFPPRHWLHEVKYPSSSNKLLSPIQEIKSSHWLCFIKLGFIKINLSF